VSSELERQVGVELAQLHRPLDSHRPLLEACASRAPSAIELSALAALLHSFYTGVENLFKRVAIKLDGALPRGEVWHRRLLNSVAAPGEARPAVISKELRDRLRGYLDFRHVFRHAYTFDLRWEKMAGLVGSCAETLGQLEAELRAFLRVARGG